MKEKVPFIVQMPLSSSSRFIHFSVFANVKVDHYWSFQNRVIVTVDTKCMKFSCKCSPGRRSCLHKCITKWALAEWNPQLLESVPPCTNADTDVADEPVSLEEDDEEDPEVTATTSIVGPFYPPAAECAIRMSEYILNNKKIPPDSFKR